MTRFDLRLGGTTLHVSSNAIIVIGAIVCAVLIMSSFVSTLRDSVQRGESFREAQRSGTLVAAAKEAPKSSPKNVLALTR